MLRYEWIWEKAEATGHLNAKKMPMKAHENCLVFYKSLPVYNPQKTTGHVRKVSKSERYRLESDCYGNEKGTVYYDSTDRYPRSVLKFSKDTQKSKLHNCQKPVALMEYFIKTYTNEGDLVLDNCAGSGSTIIAAINMNRHYIGIEKDQKYFDTMNKRIEEHLKK